MRPLPFPFHLTDQRRFLHRAGYRSHHRHRFGLGWHRNQHFNF